MKINSILIQQQMTATTHTGIGLRTFLPVSLRAIITLLLLGFTAKAQSVVTLDCNTSKLDKRLPFDEVFILRLLNLKEASSSIEISIREIPPTKLVQDPIRNVTEDDFERPSKSSYTTKRNGPFKGDSILIGIPYTLKPNGSYMILVSSTDTVPLNNDEKKDLEAFLTNTKSINEAINQVIDTFVVE